MKYILFLFLFSTTLFSKAQEIISSNTSIESCLDGKDCQTINGISYLFYDDSRNEFFLKIDFSNFRNEKDTLNAWLNDLIDTTLFFKAILPKESFPPAAEQTVKSYKINGEIFFNDKVQQQVVEISIFSTLNSMIISGNSNLKYDAYKLNFSVPIVTKDFKVYKKISYLNQTISVNVTMGRINLLKPGMEFHLKEVYFQSTH